jgi:phage baseplate assembly protein W
MATLPQFQKTNVVWLDVNTRAGENGKPDLVANLQAVNNSLYNLFRCNIGARGPIFQPEYGTGLMYLLEEPLDYITANKIRIVLIQAIQRWEPRVELDMNRTRVDPNRQLAAFYVQVHSRQCQLLAQEIIHDPTFQHRSGLGIHQGTAGDRSWQLPNVG